jgi:hypothetical protein
LLVGVAQPEQRHVGIASERVGDALVDAEARKSGDAPSDRQATIGEVARADAGRDEAGAPEWATGRKMRSSVTRGS